MDGLMEAYYLDGSLLVGILSSDGTGTETGVKDNLS